MFRAFNHGWLKPALAAAVLLQAAAFAQAQKPYANGRSSQTFRRGDAIRLTVWQPWRLGDGKNPGLDLNGQYPIDSRGYVFFPLVGEVKVVGHSPTTLADVLKEKFSPYLQEPVILVEPLIRVAIVGSLHRPGTYLVDPKASFWQLVDLAGGPTDNSNLEKMFVTRGGKTIKKKLLSGFENAYSLEELGINSGDQIHVPERRRFRVRDALEAVRFVVSIANLYFLIKRF